MIAAAMNLVRFTDHPTASSTVEELDRFDAPVSLRPGVTLHAGFRHGIPTFVIEVAGAGDLSAVISTAPLDD